MAQRTVKWTRTADIQYIGILQNEPGEMGDNEIQEAIDAFFVPICVEPAQAGF